MRSMPGGIIKIRQQTQVRYIIEKKRNSDASVASQSRSWYTSHTLPSVYNDEQKETWMHNLQNRGRRSTSSFDAVALVVSAVRVASCRATVKRKKKEEKKKEKKKKKERSSGMRFVK